MNLGRKWVYFLSRAQETEIHADPKSLSDWLMNPACRASSRAMKPIRSRMSGFFTRRLISLYSTQPENSAVTELIRKSRNS